MSTEKQGGYGKPPKAHQWQPGQSGNPSGKKKAVAKKEGLTLLEMLAEEIGHSVQVTENGKKCMAPNGKVLVRTFMINLIKAPLKHQTEAIKLMYDLGVFDLQKTLFENIDDFVDPFSETERRYIKFMQDCVNGEEDGSFDEGTL